MHERVTGRAQTTGNSERDNVSASMEGSDVGGVRDATANPFDAGSDQVPRVWAGRHEQLADWRDRLRPRRLGGQAERGRVLLGEDGIGKSALVGRIAALAAEAGDLTTGPVRVVRGAGPLPALGRAVLQVAEELDLPDDHDAAAQAVLRMVRGLARGGAGDPSPGEAPRAQVALRQLLITLGLAGLRDGRVLLVHVDEVQEVEDGAAMAGLLGVLGGVLAHEQEVTAPSGQRLVVGLPIAVYLTGLPEFRDADGVGDVLAARVPDDPARTAGGR